MAFSEEAREIEQALGAEIRDLEGQLTELRDQMREFQRDVREHLRASREHLPDHLRAEADELIHQIDTDPEGP